jgi:hypothetical protein
VIGNSVDLLTVHTVCAQVTRTLANLAGGPTLDINPVIFPTSEWDHPEPDSLADRLRAANQLVHVYRPVVFVATEHLSIHVPELDPPRTQP